MGTWGFLPLDNDTALDWCGELDDAAPSERSEMVANALQYAIKTSGNMWLDNTQVAIAAAAVVASQLEDGPFITTVSLDVAHLMPLAAQALNEILDRRASTWRSEFIEEIEKLRDILASSSGRLRPEVQWSAVATKGFSDRPTQSDLLQRSSLIEVIADLLSPMRNSDVTRSSLREGPQVIGIEGVWGSGKTSVMHLIASKLKTQAEIVDYARYPPSRLWPAWRPSRITPFMAHRLLGIWRPRPIPKPSGKYTPIEKYGSEPMPVVATFEPWAHQSSEQVWAALARTITQAGTEALYKSEGERRKYWLSRNAERVDTTPLRQALWRGVASPLLRVSIFALIVSIVVQLLKPDTRFSLLGIGALELAWLLPALLLAAGLAHTVARYLLGRADAFLPAAVVAAQISEVYGQGELAKTATYGDDPTPGWSFLRKMIQLPVILPRLTDDAVEGYVRALLGDIEPQVETIERLDSESQQSLTTSGDGVATAVAAVKVQAGDMAAERPKNIGRRPSLLERHPEVREVLRNRLAASNGSSGRETKRFLTVWQFYLRVTINSLPDVTLSNGVLLAKRLVFASEIIVRWPAYLRQLCKPIDGKSALILLVENIDNDLGWTSTLAKIGLDKPAYSSVAKNLRSLLRCDDSKEIAILTMRLI